MAPTAPECSWQVAYPFTYCFASLRSSADVFETEVKSPVITPRVPIEFSFLVLSPALISSSRLNFSLHLWTTLLLTFTNCDFSSQIAFFTYLVWY